MVAADHQNRAIAINLRTAESALADLPEFATAPQDDWGDWSDDWIQVMARLGWVAGLAQDGKLSVEQSARYEALLRRLRDCLPLTRELDLPVPEKVLAALRAPEHQRR